jgi:hypothetical protein
MTFVIDASGCNRLAFKEQHTTIGHALARIETEAATVPAL